MKKLKRLSNDQTSRYRAEISSFLKRLQSKLLDRSLPLQFKAVFYVRICCIAMSQLNYLLPAAGLHSNSENSHSILLNKLCEQAPNWWEDCWVNDCGVLRSAELEIDLLLQPLSNFVEFCNDCQSRQASQISTMPRHISYPMAIALNHA